MKNIVLILIVTIPVLAFAQKGEVQTKMYSWKKPDTKVQENLYSTILFEGSTYDMEYLNMSANALLQANHKIALQVPSNEEHLLIIKKGTLNFSLKDSAWALGGASVALLMPDEKYSIQTRNDSCMYYVMKYRSKLPVDLARAKTSGASLIKDWNKLTFKPTVRGGGRSYFDRPTAMCKRFEMHVTTLKEGLRSHDPHRHRAEEIILVIDNQTEMEMGNESYKGGAGDIYYIGSNITHGIRNDSKGLCSYFAFQFE
jgi:(S)-ureidoglycine aminohydrolase